MEKAFLQIAIQEEDRDAFRFLSNINGMEQHLRFAIVPFGVEASPFILGAYNSSLPAVTTTLSERCF